MQLMSHNISDPGICGPPPLTMRQHKIIIQMWNIIHLNFQSMSCGWISTEKILLLKKNE
jgi:hypothetical protein